MDTSADGSVVDLEIKFLRVHAGRGCVTPRRWVEKKIDPVEAWSWLRCGI